MLADGGAAHGELHKAAALVGTSQTEATDSAFAAAEAALKRIMKSHPADERSALALGLLYSPGNSAPQNASPRPEDAAQAFETAIRINPESILALDCLARVLKTSDLARAVELRESIVRLDPTDLDARNLLAHLYVNQGSLELAESTASNTLNDAKKVTADFAQQEARFILGRVYMERGEYERSEALWRSGAMGPASPHRACAYQGLGELYRRLGRATDRGDKPNNHAPTPRQAYLNALSSYHSGQLSDALAHIEQATRDNPEPAYLVLKGYFLLFDKRYEEAEKLFETAKRADGGGPGPDVGLGHIDIAKRRYSSARRKLQPAIAWWLEHGSASGELAGYYQLVQQLACLGMGWVHANQNRHDEAIDFFDRILSLQPEDLLALLGTGNSLIALQRLDEAETIFTRVLNQDEGNPYALAELGTLRAMRGDAQAAESDFRRAMERGGKDYTCPYEGLGLLYLQQGRIDEARKHLHRAIEINPNIEYKKFNGLARIYIAEGRIDEARGLLRRSIQNFPYDNEAKSLLEKISASNQPTPDP